MHFDWCAACVSIRQVRGAFNLQSFLLAQLHGQAWRGSSTVHCCPHNIQSCFGVFPLAEEIQLWVRTGLLVPESLSTIIPSVFTAFFTSTTIVIHSNFTSSFITSSYFRWWGSGSLSVTIFSPLTDLSRNQAHRLNTWWIFFRTWSFVAIWLPGAHTLECFISCSPHSSIHSSRWCSRPRLQPNRIGLI